MADPGIIAAIDATPEREHSGIPMRTPCLLLTMCLVLTRLASAYEISGAKPVDQLAAQQAKAKEDKKLLCIVYKGADNNCPHCAAAAANGIKAVHASAEMVVVTEAQVKDKTLMGTLPKSARDMLQRQPTNAWVSFTVFDPDMTKVIATGDRSSLETDKKAIHDFGDKVREARKALQQPESLAPKAG